MLTYTEENYIKAIFKLAQFSDAPVGTNKIAEHTQTKAASVTDMLKKLANKKLLLHKKYQGVQLTQKGETQALEIIRRHRLWEMFLVEKLKFSWDEVHEVAEELEHVKSKKLIDHIDASLGFPKYDPHGDPIPDENGKLGKNKSRKLNEIKIGETVRITGVIDHSTAFLKYLDKSNIALGDEISVEEISEYDSSVRILIKNKNRMFISKDVTQNLLVS